MDAITAAKSTAALPDAPRPLPAAAGAEHDRWRMLALFNGLRLMLALALLVGALRFAQTPLLRSTDFDLFVAAALFYPLAALLAAAAVRFRRPDFEYQLTAQIVVDIVILNVLAVAAGGVNSGLPMAMILSIAGAGMVSGGRMMFFYASLAAIALLLVQGLSVLKGHAEFADFFHAGLLSAGYFATALLAYLLARSAQASEQLVAQRDIDVTNLAEVNKLVIRDMSDGVLVIGEDMTIRAANRQAERLFGSLMIEARPLIGDYAPELAERLESWIAAPEHELAPLRAPTDGREVSPRFVAIGHGDHRSIVSFLCDLSRQQEEVKQVKLAALGRLTASIAHEIRNPLSSINHAAELLSEDETQTEGNRRLLTIIQDNSLRLDRMVQEVLHLNRRDQAHLEPLPPREYLKQFVAEFKQIEKAPDDVFSLEIDTDRPILFDRIHLHQVLWNLTRNAWRYCQKKAGSLRICLSEAALENMLQLDIIDDGPGVEAEYQDQLFEPFFTTDSKGTGLGLYIARQVCQANGASLDYVSVAPGGQFRILLKTP